MFTGDKIIDVREANRKAGYLKTPRGYIWHHKEDLETLQLVPQHIHKSVAHTGGRAILRNGGFDK